MFIVRNIRQKQALKIQMKKTEPGSKFKVFRQAQTK